LEQDCSGAAPVESGLDRGASHFPSPYVFPTRSKKRQRGTLRRSRSASQQGLRDSNGTLLVSNNDWQDNPTQAAEIIAAGLAPSNGLESAIATTLPPGAYTALLAGLNDGTGIGVVEVYDLGGP
jgi:hypothetical protein